MSNKFPRFQNDRQRLEYLRKALPVWWPPTGGGGSFTISNNYSGLPDPTTVDGKLYMVVTSQGTQFWPNWLGGSDYFPKGFYYSTGGNWTYIGEFPYQSTTAQVIAEASPDTFVSPFTLGLWFDQKQVELSQIRGITVSSSPPSSPQTNDLWIDTS